MAGAVVTEPFHRQDLGTKSRILNLRHGETRSAIAVATWMRDVVRPTIAVKCPKNGIKYVVNDDGTIGDYIELIEPAPVDDDEKIGSRIRSGQAPSCN